MVVGDVSGHGLGPAMLMAMTHAHLQSLVRVYADVPQILSHTNNFLLNESDYFVTLLFLCIDPQALTVRYVSQAIPAATCSTRRAASKLFWRAPPCLWPFFPTSTSRPARR